MVSRNLSSSFESLFQSLLDIMPSVEASKRLADHVGSTGHFRFLYYKDFRTVGFAVPRQCGKTSWLVQKVKNDPTAIIVTKDKWVRKIIVDWGVDEGQVISVGSVKSTPVPQGTKTVYVDSAYYTLAGIGVDDFYRWVATTEDDELVVVTVGN